MTAGELQPSSLTSFDCFDGDTVTHVTVCDAHMKWILTDPEWAMLTPEMCIPDGSAGHQPQTYCDECDRVDGESAWMKTESQASSFE